MIREIAIAQPEIAAPLASSADDGSNRQACQAGFLQGMRVATMALRRICSGR